MKRSFNLLTNFLSILFFVVLGIALVIIVQTTRVTDQGETQVIQLPENTPANSPKPMPGPTQSPEPSPVVQAYPPPEETQPVPPTAILPTPVVLPPLRTCQLVKPFREMRVVYSKYDPPGYFSSKVDGTDEIKFDPWSYFADQQGGFTIKPQVSPDGSKLLYTLWDSQKYAEGYANAMSIWVSDPDGTNIKLLVTQNPDWYPLNAIWSPNSQEIAYRRANLEEPGKPTIRSYELWIMDPDGGNQRLVTSDSLFSLDSFGGDAPFFRWSCNGYIYFVNRSEQLIAVNPQSGELYPLIKEVDAFYIASAFSPDGKFIVSSSALPASTIEKGGASSISISGETEGWSADGSVMVYVKDGIWIRNTVTGQEQLLVTDKNAIMPTLSPDAKFLAYETGDGLFVTDVVSEKVWLITPAPKTEAGYRTVEFYFWIPVP